MQLLAMLGTALWLVASLTLTFVSSLPKGLRLERRPEVGLPAGYVEVPLTIKGKIGPHEVEMSGTVNEILAHLEKHNPTWNRAMLLEQDHEAYASNFPNFTERAALDDHTICCPVPGQSFSNADLGRSNTNVDYLSHLYGSWCYVGSRPGGGACARVACMKDSGIWLCNDNDNDINYWCPDIGRMASIIPASCKSFTLNPRGFGWNTCGQTFSDWQRINMYISGTVAFNTYFCP